MEILEFYHIIGIIFHHFKFYTISAGCFFRTQFFKKFWESSLLIGPFQFFAEKYISIIPVGSEIFIIQGHKLFIIK